MMTLTEENYLKALFHLSLIDMKWKAVGTNELAIQLSITPASVNNMLKKLKLKKMISYEKYGKITLTILGKKNATLIVRKHRLWETFLYKKLDFTWDEVHQVAEELEHIQSDKLIAKLDKFLNYPKFDPHGDVIPNDKGEIMMVKKTVLSEIEMGKICRVIAVKDNSTTFLQYIQSLKLELKDKIKLISRQDFDSLTVIEVNKKKISVSKQFCENVYVELMSK
jgi:DtxR family transcriptional regulator, Mn-dependent transcriptional regulator